MRPNIILSATVAAQLASALGFASYREIRSGESERNAGEIAYHDTPRSNTLFLYIQIQPGVDDSDVIADFKTLANNYNAKGISVIPRVRYGVGETFMPEPEDQAQILADVDRWVDVFKEVKNMINIPVIQAGFLGLWGEWHDGPFCQKKGIDETWDNIQFKAEVANRLLTIGPKIALRYPQDHSALGAVNVDQVTIHNDCMMNEGHGGTDGGTFPQGEAAYQEWSEYVKRVASGNSYGGEPCNQADGSTYDWSNYAEVCGPNGLQAYIEEFGVAYLNPGNPPELGEMFKDPAWSDCIDSIQAALEKNS